MLSTGSVERMLLADGNTRPGGDLMPATFNVTLVVDNLELTDDNLDLLFDALPDALPADIAGLVTVASPIEAETSEAAAFALIDIVTDLFPDAVPSRLDQDLVSIPDIASRTDRTRESIRLLVDGKRGPGSFPMPVGTVGDGIRVWPWAVVLEWFAERMGEDLGELAIPPQTAAVVDACLAARRQRLAHRRTLMWRSEARGSERLTVAETSTQSRYAIVA
jgi:hypothetical protein